MTEKLDAIIFGATGYSGKVVVKDAINLLSGYKWGVAGRNEAKLKALLKEISDTTGKNITNIPIILADVSDENSIQAMAKKCKIILNCCGPYRFWGEVVVKACIEAGTHHVDISGEPQYFNKMYLKYHEQAEKNNTYIVSTCGFDSLPAELGVVFAEKNFTGTINSVENYWENSMKLDRAENKAVLNSGTWDSLVHALSDVQGMYALEKAVIPKNFPPLCPKLGLKYLIHRVGFSRNYFLPFPGVDRGVVRRSQYYLYEHQQKRPIQFEVYLGFQSFITALAFPFILLFLLIFANIPFTKKLLLKYPEKFSFGYISKNGPPEENIKGSVFTMTFVVKGWDKEQPESEKPNKGLVTRVTGQNGYAITSIGLLSTAKMILEEADKMPGSGGVLTPGAAFRNTSIIDVLSKHGNLLKFEVLQN